MDFLSIFENLEAFFSKFVGEIGKSFSVFLGEKIVLFDSQFIRATLHGVLSEANENSERIFLIIHN